MQNLTQKVFLKNSKLVTSSGNCKPNFGRNKETGCKNCNGKSNCHAKCKDYCTPITFLGEFNNTNLNCNPSPEAIEEALGFAQATDGCEPFYASYIDTYSYNICGRSITRTFSATDKCCKTSSVSRTVTYTVDTEDPVITLDYNGYPEDGKLGCNPNINTIDAALGTAEVTDNCTAQIDVETGPVEIDQSVSCGYKQTRYWNAIDACGNSASANHTVYWTEAECPTIIISGEPDGTFLEGQHSSAETDPVVDEALGYATVDSECSYNIDVVTSDVFQNGLQFCQTRTWYIEAACCEVDPISKTICWADDQGGGGEPGDPDIFVNCGTEDLGCNPSEVQIETALGSAKVYDYCDNLTIDPYLVYEDVDVIVGCVTTRTRTWNYLDSCGRSATASCSTSWKSDTLAPVITATGTTLTLGCNPTDNQINAALGSATATDSCDGNVTVTFEDSNIMSSGCTRSQTRTFFAEDSCGNQATPVSRVITWTNDTTAPTLTCPANTNIACGATVTYGTPTATDACDPNPTINVVSTVVNGNINTRTWQAVDACGNQSATCSQTITVASCVVNGCTTGSWRNSNGTGKWNQLSDTLVQNMPGPNSVSPVTPGGKFITTTNFATYFGITVACGDIKLDITMLNALSLTGGGCNNLARQGVAALLNLAQFGSTYPYPGTFTDLYNAIKTGLSGCNSSTCTTLANTLSGYNNNTCTIISNQPMIVSNSTKTQTNNNINMNKPNDNNIKPTKKFIIKSARK